MQQSRSQQRLMLYPITLLLVGWIRVGTEIPLDKVARFICDEAEEDMEPVHVARVETDMMSRSHGIEGNY
jgi:hypothetical protein